MASATAQHGDGVVTWDPPGPGTWELDTAHVGPTTSRMTRDVLCGATGEGLAVGFEMMGAPLARIDARFVNGGYYLRLVPLVGGERDLPDPPKPLLWLATRLHPTFRRRTKQSEVALTERIWLAEHARWESTWKPQLIEDNRRYGAVDVASLDDVGLADHVDALYRHLFESAVLHFRLHSSDLGPIGRLLVAAGDWGLDPNEVMRALAGASPSTSAPADAVGAIRAELDALGVVPESLDDVRAAGTRAAEMLDAYLADFGVRLTTGYDLRDLTLAELPDVVLASILEARVGTTAAAHAIERGADALGGLRAELDPAHHAEFDELVADARLLYGLRDENGPLTYEWPAGILRRAILEAARRLVAVGRIDDVEHVFDLSAAELSSVLRGRSTPTAPELADRCRERMSWADLDHPPVLGRPPTDPPVDLLPGRMGELMRAVTTVMTLLEGNVDDDDLAGTGVGDSSYRGTARVVHSAEEAFERVEAGDILVTRLTVPTYNSVLAMAGGVVTQNGGLLCHTAVIARELGIPAVVGVKGALGIPDGAELEIDPVAGRVQIVDG